MPVQLPGPGADPRAVALIQALSERAKARLELSEALLEMETSLARVEPIPLDILQRFEARMVRLRDVQERVAALTSTAP